MSVTVDDKTYYIVKVFLKPVHDRQEGEWMWLAVSSGYPAHFSIEPDAEHFPNVPDIDEIRKYSGMPWYCEHDLDVPPRIFRVRRILTVNRDEVI